MSEEPDPANADSPTTTGRPIPPVESEDFDEEDARIAPASLAWFLGSVLLIVLTCVIYRPVIRDGWTRYDNMLLIARQPMVQDLSPGGLKTMFTSFHHDLYQPLLTLSLAVDYRLNQRDPAGHQDAPWPPTDLTGWHLHSLAVHLLTVVLLFLLIGRMTGHVFAAWIGTALVALHPLVVEPVTWLICRTFLLAGFWIVLGCHFYLSYARRPRWWLYLLSLLCFGLSTLAKLFMGLFLLPLVLDLWCQRRRWGVLILEKLPLLVLVAVLVYFNSLRMFGEQRAEPLPDLSMGEMLRRGLVGVCWTAANIFLPRDLSIFYGPSESAWGLFLSRAVCGGFLIAAVLVIALAAVARKRSQLLLCMTGWAVLFAPLLAAIRVRETVTADRYNYVPFFMLALGVAWLLSRWFKPAGPAEPVPLEQAGIAPGRVGGYLGSLLLLVICGWLLTESRAHAKVWADDVLLWEAAAERTPHRTAYGQLANALITQARTFRKAGGMEQVEVLLSRAEQAIQKGLELSPDDGALLENHGVLCITRADDWRRLRATRQQAGDTAGAEEAAQRRQQYNEQALALFRRSVEVRPVSPGAWNGLGVALLRLGRYDQAKEALSKSLELSPNYATAMRNLGTVLRHIRRAKETQAAGLQDSQAAEALRNALLEEADLLDRLGHKDEAAGLRERADQVLAEAGDSDDPGVLIGRADRRLKTAMEQSARAERLLAPSRMRKATPEQQQQLRAAADEAHQEQVTQARAAEAIYRRLLSVNDSSASGWQRLGQALLYQGKTTEADQAFSRAIELDPQDADALAAWARLLAINGQTDRAAELLNRAVQIKPGHEHAWFDLFRLHFSQGRVAEATEAMKKLYQDHPENGTYRQLLRQLYEKQGRREEAARLAQPPTPGG